MRRACGFSSAICLLPLLASQAGAMASDAPEPPMTQPRVTIEAAPDASRVDPAPMERSRHVARVALGIIAYTRWPDDRRFVRLCLLGWSDHAEALVAAASLPGARRLLVEHLDEDDGRIAERCDVAYVAARAEAQWPAIYRQLAGRPILSICEQPGPCRAGGMFCLDLRGAEIRFEANLDSIARSGVRVHPQALQLGRRRQGST